MESSGLAASNSGHCRSGAHITLRAAHLRSCLSVTCGSLFLSLLVTTGATPSLPAPSLARCISSCCSSHLQIVGCSNTMLFLCEQLEDVSHAPSLQPACLCTCSALKQAHLTFNSNYTLLVTKPQSQDI